MVVDVDDAVWDCWRREGRMQARALIIQLAIALVVVIGSSSSGVAGPGAPASVDAELLTVHATSRGRTIDPRLGKHAAMSKPPLSAYTNYKVLRRGGAILAKGMAWKTTLPNKRDLMISLKDVIVSKKKRAPVRFVVVANLAKADGTSFEPVLETEVSAGETFFVPAGSYGGGIVVVAVKLLADRPASTAPVPNKRR